MEQYPISSVSPGTAVAAEAEITTAIHQSIQTEKDNNLAVPAGEGALELSPSHVVVSMSPVRHGRQPPRRMHRVPEEMRLNKDRSQHLYDPVVVSLGPYHHGESHLARAEELKDDLVRIFLLNSGRDKGFFYNPIMEIIDEIRACYVGVTIDDATLAEMMLRDGVWIIYFLTGPFEHFNNHLGLARFNFMNRDYFMVENQIPYSVIKLLIQLRFGKNHGEAIVRRQINYLAFGDIDKLTRLPWEDDEEEPLHLLEAHRMAINLKKDMYEEDRRSSPLHCCTKYRWSASRHDQEINTEHDFERTSTPYRSVTDLVSKGIHLVPSSNCLRDITFSSYAFHGELRIPIWFVSTLSRVSFSNYVAFELLPESHTDRAITSYIQFMKSLIQSSKDVKKLREKGILFGDIVSDEEVVELFKNIDTLGMGNIDAFVNVKRRVEKHCRSKRKTWMADLIHKYFESPWTVIALLAAAFLLFLTFSQTYMSLLAYLPDHMHKKQPG